MGVASRLLCIVIRPMPCVKVCRRCCRFVGFSQPPQGQVRSRSSRLEGTLVGTGRPAVGELLLLMGARPGCRLDERRSDLEHEKRTCSAGEVQGRRADIAVHTVRTQHAGRAKDFSRSAPAPGPMRCFCPVFRRYFSGRGDLGLSTFALC